MILICNSVSLMVSLFQLGLQTHTTSVIFSVGESASITCSSDLDVTSIEWLYEGQVVSYVAGQQELKIVFNPVNDTVHNSEYTCRVTSPYGIQENTIPVIAEGKQHLFNNHIYRMSLIIIVDYDSEVLFEYNCRTYIS